MLGAWLTAAGEPDWWLAVMTGVACLIAGLVAARLFRRARRARARHASTARPDSEIRQQNIRLDAALNNMTQGLCMFDADETVVVVNRRFLEMYRLSPQVVKPGCTFRELIQHRWEVGLLDADPEQYYPHHPGGNPAAAKPGP